MTLFYLVLAGFAVAFGVTAWMTPLVGRLAVRRGWTDQPDGRRKLHRRVTPSIGGVAIFCGTVCGMALVLWAAPRLSLAGSGLHPFVVLGACIMAATGAIDDVRGLGFKARLVVEALVAAGLVYVGVNVDLSPLVGLGMAPAAASTLGATLTILWVVGVTNAVNMIDGIDGLAGGVVGIAFVSLAVVFGLSGDLALAAVAAVFVGAVGGFLVHNFSPATIFMGDSGSLFLGYSLAVYAITAPASSNPILGLLVPVLALGLPILDTVLSMVRRAVGKRSIYAPDRDHIHHRMVDRMETRRAVIVLYGVASMFGVLAVLMSFSTWTGGTAAMAAAAVVIVALLLRLGYVRFPYSSPSLRPIPALTQRETPNIDDEWAGEYPLKESEAVEGGDGIVSAGERASHEPALQNPT